MTGQRRRQHAAKKHGLSGCHVDLSGCKVDYQGLFCPRQETYLTSVYHFLSFSNIFRFWESNIFRFKFKLQNNLI